MHCRFPLSKWALELNELTPELKAKLPPTDDRLRPDMRLFEHGSFNEVTSCCFMLLSAACKQAGL